MNSTCQMATAKSYKIEFKQRQLKSKQPQHEFNLPIHKSKGQQLEFKRQQHESKEPHYEFNLLKHKYREHVPSQFNNLVTCLPEYSPYLWHF